MFSNIFEERNKTITHLVKLGDCIGRSIRENVSLFSIDSMTSEVSYLTESGKVISGKYNTKGDITLNNIKVQDSSIFEDEAQFDKFVSGKIHSLVENIHYGEYGSADTSFDDVLSLWENRLKLSSVQKKLHEQSKKLSSIEKIIESAEFSNLLEITPQLQTFLKKNLNKIISVPEIRNAVNLSNTVSNAFNLPKLTLEELEQNKKYTVEEGINTSIYEMICRQELVKKELIESKKNFETVWANNTHVRRLAGMIFESDENVVNALSEAIKEVPYIALASKKTLFNTFSNCLAQADGIGVSEKDIQQFASRIFEYKKEVKDLLINTMNERYGVDIMNLQEPASFKSLANTQVVIFETLSRLAPKGSVLKEVLSEMAICLKTKSGVECIDVNDYLMETFVSVGYDSILEEAMDGDLPKVNFKRVSKDLLDIQELIMMLKQKVADQQYPSDENMEQEQPSEEDMPPEAGMPPQGGQGMPPQGGQGMPPQGGQGMPPPPEGPEAAEGEPAEIPQQQPQGEVVSDLADLENMVADLAAELGMDQGEEQEPEMEEPGMEEPGMEEPGMEEPEPPMPKKKPSKGKKPLPTEVEEE